MWKLIDCVFFHKYAMATRGFPSANPTENGLNSGPTGEAKALLRTRKGASDGVECNSLTVERDTRHFHDFKMAGSTACSAKPTPDSHLKVAYCAATLLSFSPPNQYSCQHRCWTIGEKISQISKLMAVCR